MRLSKRILSATSMLLAAVLVGVFVAPASAQAASVSATFAVTTFEFPPIASIRGTLPLDLPVGDCRARGGSTTTLAYNRTTGIATVNWTQLALTTSTIFGDVWHLTVRFRNPVRSVTVSVTLPDGDEMEDENRLYLWDKDSAPFQLSAATFATISQPGSTVEWLSSC